MTLKSIPTVFLEVMLSVTIEINTLLSLFSLTWCHHLRQHIVSVKKLLWWDLAVTLPCCGYWHPLQLWWAWMEGRLQFCSLIFHWVVITESHPDRTTVRPVDLVSLNSLLKPVLPRTREPDGKAPLLYSASLSCGQGFSFEIQVYSTNKPHKLIVLRSLTCVAFILVHSTFFTWC